MANSTRANIEGLVADGLRLRSQANQGSQQPLREQENVAHDAAIDAAAGAPVRRRRKIKQDRQVTAYLAEYNDVEAHLQENEFIKRYYRKGYSFKRSFFSLFSLHNETGNIWTHLVGFLIFLCLTYATFHLPPEPLRLGTEAITKLEQRLFEVGKHNLFDLLQTAESWERHAVQYGQERIAVLEDTLRQIGRENLHELTQLRHTLANFSDKVGNVSFTGVSQAIKDVGRSGIAELQSIEDRISHYGTETVRDIEDVFHRALANLIEGTWPAKRWPIYVFLSGAMMCLLTSATCHLFGCVCNAHLSLVIWRFDYAGIAVLIVASFFPPVYYSFMCQPMLRVVYLTVTSILGLMVLGVSLLDRFQTPKLMVYRAALFVSLGSWGFVPMLHAWAINNNVPEFAYAMRLHLLMGLLYVLGAGVYAARIPERWAPGRFDLAFQSHQLFHIAVVVAAVVHYRASNVLVNWRDATGGCMLNNFNMTTTSGGSGALA